MTILSIDADPYPWPFDGSLAPETTALIVIDMQTDFCGVGGYVDTMGYDLSLTRAPIEPISRVLATLRPLGYTIIHTREGHRPDLSDLPENKRHLSRKSISIYLYTKDRPAQEIAPMHGTFYVQRPLPGRLQEGHTLNGADVRELKTLLKRRDEGVQHVVFAVGPAEGWSPEALAEGKRRGGLLSLGPMTLAHQLARLVVAEQLYRACTILTGHPYHRG